MAMPTRMTCLHCTRSDQGSGGQAGDGLRCDRAYASGRKAARGTGSSSGGCRGACACARATGDMARAGADLAREQFLEDQDRPNWHQGGERCVVALQLLAESPAAFAGAHMTPRGRTHLQQPLGRFSKLLAHLLAGELPGLRGLSQRDPRSDQQRLDRGDGGLHRLRDLVVGERVYLSQQQRRALGLWKLLDVGDQLPEALATHHLLASGDPTFCEMDIHRVHANR